MVPGDARALGIRVGVGLIEQFLYKHANFPVGPDIGTAQQAAEEEEYARRVDNLYQKMLRPNSKNTAVENEAKVLSVPQ